MRLAVVAAALALVVAYPAHTEQRPSHKPAPPAVVRLQPPSPSARQPNQPNQRESTSSEQHSNPEQRGTEDRPIFVQGLPAKKTQAERTQEEQDRRDKASADRWALVFAGALVAVSFFQFLALIGQAIVFWIQAKALRESVDLTRTVADRQERDMHVSIAEASRAATAMEGVAAGINESVTNTRELFATQRRFAKLQLRPYLSIVEPGFVAQDAERRLFAGIQVHVLNTGHSPAHDFRSVARTKILPFPLPENFDFTIPNEEAIPSGHINPGQRFFFRRDLDRLIPDDELRDIMAGQERRLYIYGTVFFVDPFGDDHYTFANTVCGMCAATSLLP